MIKPDMKNKLAIWIIILIKDKLDQKKENTVAFDVLLN